MLDRMQVKNKQLEELQNSEFTFITWDISYATGIPLIDSQHRELVNLTNQLYNACRGGNEKAGSAFKEAMSAMVEYVRFHFSTEQKLLERINYPDYKKHKMMHDTLIKDILEAAQNYHEGKKFVPNQFVRTLKEWVFGHIAVYDKNYSFYVHEQKRKGLLTDKQLEG